MSVVKKIEELKEEPHPFLKSVGIRILYSKKEDRGDITCFIVRCKIGSEIEEHVHSKETDHIYVLEGKAMMWVEDRGEILLEPGVFVSVPKGFRHRTYNVEKELVIYDVFSPAMF